MDDKKFEIISWIHLVLIILIWSSPFWLSWKIVSIGIILYYLQLLIFGDCLLTKKEFRTNKREITFYSFCLEKIGFMFDRNKVRIIADYVMPWVILGVSLIWQLGLGNKVWLG